MERVKPEIRARVNDYLNELIKQAGNVTAFANSIGVPRDTVNNWLQERSDIRLNDLVKISQKYDVSVDHLLGLSEYPTLNQDEKEAAAYTGLSVEAVAALHRQTGKYINPYRMENASALIASNTFVQLLSSMEGVRYGIEQLNEIERKPPNMKDIDAALRDMRISVFECTEVFKGVLDELFHTNKYYMETAEHMVYGDSLAEWKRKGAGEHEQG